MTMMTPIAGTALALLVAVTLLGASGRSDVPAPGGAGPQEVDVVAVMVSRDTQQPAVVLQGKRDQRLFAMAIGPAEATGIAVPLQQITPPRPLTHDLFLSLFARLNVTVKKVLITDLRDDIYYATLYLVADGAEIALDSRPSDAIALAVRAKAPVYVEDRVFEKSQRLPTPAPPEGSRI